MIRWPKKKSRKKGNEGTEEKGRVPNIMKKKRYWYCEERQMVKYYEKNPKNKQD